MDSSQKEGAIGSQKQRDTQKMEAIPSAPEKLEDERKNPSDVLKKVDVADNGKEKLIFIADNLEESFELALMVMLREYQDIFAWSYQDMPGLNVSLITHKLAIDPIVKPVKQAAKNFRN